MATEVVATRRRIIRRPRLTTMLDESSARIRLLVAPAGYGKTTLAREWLGEPERNDVWYRGGPASADVAAVAAGISEAIGAIIPDAGKRMRERLRATGNPEEDVEILAELFAEDVQEWPPDAWLAIDDYQFAMESAASERFVDLLTQTTPIQMLITSRTRPRWATARRILYGEIFEIDSRALAMEDAEARAILGRGNPAIDELVIRARGWPAVLGLASLAADFVLPSDDFPETLHNYFAEEVFHVADAETRRDLALLSIAPVVTFELAAVLFGSTRAREVLNVGTRLGVLTGQGHELFAMHPLLQGFLQARLMTGVDEAARKIGEFFLARREWDHAYEVASRASLTPVLSQTIEDGLDPMLSQGRLATVQRWIDSALAHDFNIPVVDLAEAELAFRRGQHERAYALAAQAASRLGTTELRARAHIRAGHSALLASREKEGLEHFRMASRLAKAWPQRREALVGLYFAGSELGNADTEANAAITELEAVKDATPDGVLRLEVLHLTRATRIGGITEAVRDAFPKLYLVDRATDPLALTSFLHTLGMALNSNARYREAHGLNERQFTEASRYRLDFAVAHAQLNRAMTALGLRGFQEAANALDTVQAGLPDSGDAYLEAAVRTIRCRLLISTQRFLDAVDLTTGVEERITSPPLHAEFLICRALAFACIGDHDKASSLTARAESIYSSSVETQVLKFCIEAVGSLQRTGVIDHVTVMNAWEAAKATGNYDCLVCAYRAEPRLIESLSRTPKSRSGVGSLLREADDGAFARTLGFTQKSFAATAPEPLTARESEVLQELEQGASNREIANRLFISEATVKAHLRHIYEKLGVRTRSELLAKRARRQ